MAILRYARKNQLSLTTEPFSKLESVNLRDILVSAYPANICNILIKYIGNRKSYYAGQNDYVGEKEILSEESGDEVFDLIPFV